MTEYKAHGRWLVLAEGTVDILGVIDDEELADKASDAGYEIFDLADEKIRKELTAEDLGLSEDDDEDDL